MSNEMNAIPVKDSKGNVTGVSDSNGNNILNALLGKMLVQAPKTGSKNVAYDELTRWLKQNYPNSKSNPATGIKNINLGKLNEYTKMLQNYPKSGLKNLKFGAASNPIGALISLIASAPALSYGGQKIASNLLGLNETEVWRNPDRYGSGESYDPYMDPNNPMYDLQTPIKDMIKPIDWRAGMIKEEDKGFDPYNPYK
jgi:hypothetical protein